MQSAANGWKEPEVTDAALFADSSNAQIAILSKPDFSELSNSAIPLSLTAKAAQRSLMRVEKRQR